MMHYLNIDQINQLPAWVNDIATLKKNPLTHHSLGANKTLGLLFFNSSLRTRLSTQKAAQNLGMNTMVINVSDDAWGLEFEEGTIMNGTNAEHIKEAAAVIAQYCDIIAVRAFPSLSNKSKDQQEQILQSFVSYAKVPIVNMESATAHPLQGLTDAFTIQEFSTKKRPKVVLSWAPHIKPLPHAVANSFIKAMQKMEVEFVITNPARYNLDPEITKDTPIIHQQHKALENADFVYTKNWSSFDYYGEVLDIKEDWCITPEKMALTQEAKFMHCLPVRRNVVVSDQVLDSPNSIVIEQANNRTFAAQLVLQKILQHEK